MSTIIKVKRSSVQGKVPLTTDLELGEFAVNTYDGKLFTKKNVNGTESIVDLSLGTTNLGYSANSTAVTVTSDTGSDINILAANGTIAGVLTAGAQTIAGAKTFTGDILFAAAGGNEGGEIKLEVSPTGGTLAGNISIDIYQNKLRIFENGGSARGVYIDLTSAASSVGTNLLSGSVTNISTSANGSTVTVASDTGSDGVILAANSTTAGIITAEAQTIGGAKTFSGNITANQVSSTNNGAGTNFQVGDDAWIGDINLDNTIRITGQQDGTKGYIVFGNSSNTALGRTGTGSLTYGGSAIILASDTASAATASKVVIRDGSSNFSANTISVNGIVASGDVTIADKIVHSGDTDTSIRFPAADTVTVETAGTERMRITSAGNVGIGTNNPTTTLSVYNATTSIISVSGDSGTAFIAARASNDTTAPGVNFRKYRGTTATPLTVATGDNLGNSNYIGYDGSSLITAAQITGIAEAVAGTGNISGALTFLTRPAGSGTSVTEHMRITSAGNVGIGTSSPSTKLDVSGTVTATAFAGPLTGAVTGNATTATALQTARTIALSGDVAGSATFDGSANVTITATIQSNSVALGTDTTGNYVAGLTAGTGVAITGTAGEGWSPTVAIGQAVSTTSDVEFRNLTLSGNLTVNGTSTTVNATELAIEDNLIYLNEGSTITNPDIGIVGNYNDGTYAHTGVFRDATDGRWKFFKGYVPEPGQTIDTANATFQYADVQANTVYAALSGNASTATTLQTARTIAISGDVTGTATSFNGSADITISAGITANTIVNADINTAAAIADTKLATISTAGKVSNSATTANNAATANAIVARDASSNFSANTITAALAGNATTATTLQTARNINGTSFNGSGDITTANWGTSRTITIGSTGKSVNGSGNVSWTTTEMGVEYQSPVGVPRVNLGDPTVREMALFDGQFNNKTELYDINNLFFETSTDNVTWTTYSVTDAQKRLFLTGDSNASIAITNGTAYFRVRLKATSYVYLNALYLYHTSGGHTTQVQTFIKAFGSTTWTQHTNSTASVGSWPGHLYLPFNTIAWNPGAQYDEVYFLFIPTWNPSWPAQNFTLHKFQLWGGYPAGKRNIYSVSEYGDVAFPATISTANGSVTEPAFDFTSDTNTGIYLAGADTLGFATNGTAAAQFTSTGNLRLFNTAGTFYSEFSNQPTANRTLTVPDVTGTISIIQSAAAAGYFDTSTTTPTGTTRLNYGGYLYPTFLNLVGSGDTATAATHYFVETGSDGFVRPKTLANARTELVTTAAVNSAAATTVGTVTSGTWNATAITDTYLATISTAGKVSNAATTATNLNTANAIVARDASGNFTAGTITAALTGAASSNVLKAGDTMTGKLNLAGNDSFRLIESLNTSASSAVQFYVEHNLGATNVGNARGVLNLVSTGALTIGGSVALTASNFNTYAPTLTGTGASGNWGINITGNAATVTNGALTTGTLAQFAATTSAQLAGVISDETGSGALVFGTAPTFTTTINGGATFGAFASSTALTLGYTGTAASTINISTGATATTVTKTVNLGTGGAAGSTTNINIGSSVAGTTAISSPTITMAGVADTATTATHYYVETSGGNIAPKTLANARTELVTTAAVNAAGATTLGTVSVGTWNGSVISATYGGTGLSSLGTGVATFLGTPSSANLAAAVTDETGSGALVFGTSPSFTTGINAASATMALFDTTATTVNAFGATTTLNLGYDATAASTTNISTGAVAAATTKTVNIGTGGAASSTTNINIGASAGGMVTISGDVTFAKAIVETVFALSGTTPALNPSNGTIQTWTLSANSTPTDGLTSGESMTIMIDDGTARTITWPTITWVNNGGVAPTLATTGFTVIALWKVSTTLYGALVGNRI